MGAQDSTTTEDGAYKMIAEGYYPEGPFIARSADATIFLPSEDEWYKAAYYDALSMSYNPYSFADGFDGVACEGPVGATTHSANCNIVIGDTTGVGAYNTSPSGYGTFDQGGNVWEWNEAIKGSGAIEPDRGLRGGSWVNSASTLPASDTGGYFATTEFRHLGFRVAMIPEPGTGSLLALGLMALAAGRRRR